MTKDFSEDQLRRLAAEKSVRGSVVRLALKRAEEVGPGQQDTLDAALHLLLEKFATIPDQDP